VGGEGGTDGYVKGNKAAAKISGLKSALHLEQKEIKKPHGLPGKSISITSRVSSK